MDPVPSRNAGFAIAMQREFAKGELIKTTATAFLYGCGCIPPHQVLALVKASATSIVWKRCIMHECEDDWFRLQLDGRTTWVRYWCNRSWAKETISPSETDDEKLEDWMENYHP